MDSTISDYSDHENIKSTESEEDLKLIAKEQGIQLQIINENLMNENSKLRAQFDEAVKAATNIDNVHQKNILLAQELQSVTSEKNELSRRLEISIKTIYELNKKLEAQQTIANEQQSNLTLNSQKQIDEINKMYSSKIKKLIRQLEKSKETIEQEKLQSRLQNNKIDKVLTVLSHSFSKTFSSLDDIILHFKENYQTSLAINNTPQNVDPEQVPLIKSRHKVHHIQKIIDENKQKPKFYKHESNQMKILKKVTKKYHRALKHALKQNEDLQNQLLLQKQESTETIAKQLSRIEQLESSARQISEDFEMKETDSKHTISILEKKVNNLKNELEKKKTSNQSGTFDSASSSEQNQFNSTNFGSSNLPQTPYYNNHNNNNNNNNNNYNNNNHYNNSNNGNNINNNNNAYSNNNTNSNNNNNSINNNMNYGKNNYNNNKRYQNNSNNNLNNTTNTNNMSNYNKNVTSKTDEILSELKLAHSEIESRNEELSQQIIESRKKVQEYKEKMEKAEQSKREAETTVEKYKHSYSALELAHKQALEEIKVIRAALHERDPNTKEKSLAPIKQQLRQTKAELLNAQNTIDTLKKETYESKAAFERVKHDLQSQKIIERDLKFKVSELNDQITKYKDEIANISRVYDKETTTIKIEDILPRYTWNGAIFGPKLSQLMDPLASSESLQPAAKLRGIYKIIQEYYSKLLDEKDEKNKQISEEYHNYQNIMNTFLSDTSILLNLSVPSESKTILETLQAFVQQFDKQKLENSTYKSQIKNFEECFGKTKSKDDFNQKVKDLKEELVEISNKLNKEKKKVKQLRESIETLNNQKEAQEESLNNRISELTRNNSNITKKLEEANQKISSNKKELQKMKIIYEDLMNEKDDEIQSIKDQYQNELYSKLNLKQNLEDELKNQLETQTIKLLQLQEQFDSNSSLLSTLRKTIETQKEQIEEKQIIIQHLSHDIEEQKSDLLQKSQIEKEKLIESYEKAVQEISSQNEIHRNDLIKCAKELSRAEKVIKETKKSAYEANAEKSKISKEYEFQIEQLNRQLQLIEANSKAQILQLQADNTEKIREVKAKAESDIQKTYIDVIDEFREYFNASETINDRSFRSLIRKVKATLQKLSNEDSAIRKIVGASNNQRTQEAVAQLLISH